MAKQIKKHRPPKQRIPDKCAPLGGYFIDNGIVTFRCKNPDCGQHMSLSEYEIYDTGEVQPDVVCPNCKALHEDIVLDGHDSNFLKAKGEARLWKKEK